MSNKKSTKPVKSLPDGFFSCEKLCEKWFQKFGQDFSSHGIKPAKQDCLVVDYLLQSYNHVSLHNSIR